MCKKSLPYAKFSIKILDVERMVAKSSLPVDMSGAQSDSAAAVDHPVIRTLYDHLEEVTSLVFHPREQLLISGSKDYTVKVNFPNLNFSRNCSRYLTGQKVRQRKRLKQFKKSNGSEHLGFIPQAIG